MTCIAGSGLAIDGTAAAPAEGSSVDSDNLAPAPVPIELTQLSPVQGPPSLLQPAPSQAVGAAPTASSILAQQNVTQGGEVPSREWTIVPSVTVGETYNDNVNLAPKGQAQADFITTVQPGLLISATGPRLNLSLNYNPFINYYARGTTASPQILQNLIGTGRIQLVPEWFSVDAGASINQQTVNNTGAIVTTNLTNSSNSQTVQSYHISPDLKHQFGDLLISDTNYSFGSTIVGGDLIAPTVTHSLSETVSNGPAFGNLSWSAKASSSRTNSESGTGTTDPLAGTSSKDDLAEADLGYALGFIGLPGLSAIGTFGYEDLTDPSLFGDLSGLYWNGGFQYQPNQILSLKFTYGRRYNQPNYAFSGKYDTGQTQITASYAETVQTISSLAQNSLGALIPGPNGTVIDPLTGQQIPESQINLFGLQSTTFLDKLGTVTAQTTRGRNTYSITASDEIRKTDVPPQNEEVVSGFASWRRQLWPDLSSSLGASYSHINFGDGTGRVDQLYTINLGLTYTVSPNATASLNVSRSDQISTSATENITTDLVAFLFSQKF
ncbi:MAG TPA: TIGR03016 family PEP-CTERM system-associated outer membrane protein [Candidatus Sulfotelmatobacter sp.]|nr:TIGR03016 family PEP-CTERM system-associated outer membrane protein [Candidatus Sulfotelmatobacter sp.]